MPNFKIDIKTSGEEKLKKIVDNIDAVSEGFDLAGKKTEEYGKKLEENSRKTISAIKSSLDLKNSKLQEKITEESLLKTKLESLKTDKQKERAEKKLIEINEQKIKIQSEIIKYEQRIILEEEKRAKNFAEYSKKIAEKQINELNNNIKLEESYRKLNQRMKDLSNNEDGFSKQEKSVKEYEKSMKKAKNEVSEFIRAKKMALPLTEQFIRLLSKLSMASLIFISLKNYAESLGAALNSLVESAAKLEKFNLIISGLEGSNEKGAKSFDRILKLATKLPQTLEEVTEAFIKLKGQGLDNSNEALKLYSDTALAMGKPLIQGVEMMADAVTGEFERLKEYGIKAKSVAENTVLSYMDTTGKAKFVIAKNAKEIQAAISGILGSKFKGQADRFATSFDGIKAALSSTFDIFKAKLAEQSGLFENYKTMMSSLTNKLNEVMGNSEQFEEMSKKLGDFVRDTILFTTNLIKLFTTIGSVFSFVKNIIQSAATFVAGLLQPVIKMIHNFSTNIMLSIVESLNKILEIYNNVASKINNKLVIDFEFKEEGLNDIKNKIDKEWYNLDFFGDSKKYALQSFNIDNSVEIFKTLNLISDSFKENGIVIDKTAEKLNEYNSILLKFNAFEKNISSNDKFIKDPFAQFDSNKLVSFNQEFVKITKENVAYIKEIQKLKPDFMLNIKEGDLINKDIRDKELKEFKEFYHNLGNEIRTGEKNSINALMGQDGDSKKAEIFLKQIENRIKYLKETGKIEEAHYEEMNQLATEMYTNEAYTLEQQAELLLAKHNKYLEDRKKGTEEKTKQELDSWINFYKSIGDLESANKFELSKSFYEIDINPILNDKQKREAQIAEQKRIDEELKKERENQLKEIIDINNKKLDNDILYFNATKNITKLKEAEISKIRNDLKLKGFKEGSKEYEAIVLSETKKIEDNLLKQQQDYLKEENDLNNKLLDNKILYFEALEDLIKVNQLKLIKFENELKEKGFEKGSQEYLTLVKAKEKELTELVQKETEERENKRFSIQKEKLEFLERYYDSIGDVENKYKTKKDISTLALNQEKGVDSDKKEAILKRTNEVLDLEKENELLSKQKYIYDELGESKKSMYIEIEQYENDLALRQIPAQEAALMAHKKRIEMEREFREEIKETMTMKEAFEAQMNNMTKDVQAKIQSAGQQSADFAKTIAESMESNFTNFFDATSDKFLSFQDLVKGTITDILKQMSLLIAKQLAARAVMATMGGFGFGGPSFFANGGVFSGGQQVTAFADGGAFTNSVVDKPTLSPMALFGEAGPEAIMPLSRDSSGRLGVSMNGQYKNQQQVVVNSNIIVNNNSSQVKVSKSEDSKGNKVLTIEDIDAQLSSKIRNGDSKMMDIMQNKYPALQKR